MTHRRYFAEGGRVYLAEEGSRTLVEASDLAAAMNVLEEERGGGDAAERREAIARLQALETQLVASFGAALERGGTHEGLSMRDWQQGRTS